MTTGAWFIGLIVAIGVVLVASEVMPEAVNALLLLIIVGVVLSRWNQIAPLAGLVGRVAGGESPRR